MKKKNCVLGGILGFIFGPFGLVYFGWKVLATTLISVAIVALLITWLSPFELPEWSWLVFHLFYGCWGVLLALAYKESKSSGELAALSFLDINGWLVGVTIGLSGIYTATILFSDGRWCIALLTLFVFIPLTIFFVGWALSTILGIVLGLLDCFFN